MSEAPRDSVLRDALVAQLTPVRARSAWREAALVLGVGAVQLAGFAYLHTKQGGLVDLTDPTILAKVALFAAAAIGFSVSAVASLDPASRRQGQVGATLAVGIPVLALALLDRARPAPGMIESLQPAIGIGAVLVSLTLSLPVLMTLVLLMRRAAMVAPMRSGLLAGAAAGAWGILLYAIQCPMVSVWYVVPWYLGSVVIMAVGTGLAVVKTARW